MRELLIALIVAAVVLFLLSQTSYGYKLLATLKPEAVA